MLVSWHWLQDYIALDMTPAELSRRLMMAGLNHESTETVGNDLAIDLEVTSNRPDCLGHLGVAREIAVLWQRDLQTPRAQPTTGGTATADLTSVHVAVPELCPRYTARVIRGCRVASSPAWLADRLRTVGVAVINNIVDITNYVLLECGQPLHAFDLARLQGRRIIVREARAGEKFAAIDHRLYDLRPGMCVIADANRPVALGGVMGGADTEVSPATTELLIEAAVFAPRSIRATARQLNLHSPSSYRFERGVDPEGVDWASRRCCELILELAGGELAAGSVDVGAPPAPRPAVTLRWSQLRRILGIDIAPDEAKRILVALGGQPVEQTAQSLTVVPPSWRRDLTREIDLVEEVARIHGYDAIPEDVRVPMVPSHRTDEDRVLRRVRDVLTSAGFDEALTVSVVREEISQAFSPWTEAPPLISATPILRGADRLRRSLVPSLLEARRINESLGNVSAELFETAAIYLPRSGELPEEKWTLGLVSGGDFGTVKGVLEALVRALCPALVPLPAPVSQPLLHPDRSATLLLDGQCLGFLGEVTPAGLKQFELRGATTVAEIDLRVLASRAQFVRHHTGLSPFPAMSRDVNLIVGEAVRWQELADVVRARGGAWIETLEYRETYRDPQKDGPGKKRLLFSIVLRGADRTLTHEEADGVRSQIVAACHEQLGAVLLG